MKITRRWFIGGAASFGAFGAFGGNRFAVRQKFRPCGAPCLRFGVVSDIHIVRPGLDEKIESVAIVLTFRHTLEWFRSQGVDAVVIAGDLADHGLSCQLEAVEQTWQSVFPGGKLPNGNRVERVFVYGNHDWEGWCYGDFADRIYPDKAERDRNILCLDYGAWWERVFHEPYSPIYMKEVKGFRFIGSHWEVPAGKWGWGAACKAQERIVPFLDKHRHELDPSLPFFYVQHPHLKDTCYGSWAWGHDTGEVTQCLSAFPNAVAISGHSHYSLTDERSIWQGAFTSVGAGSLSHTGLPSDEHPPTGYENASTDPDSVEGARPYNATKLMDKMKTDDCRQGMLWSVYADSMVVKRREFLSDRDLGGDWVMPLATAEKPPFSFANRAQKFRAPSFGKGAKITVERITAKNRGGTSADGKETIASVEKEAFRLTAPPHWRIRRDAPLITVSLSSRKPVKSV